MSILFGRKIDVSTIRPAFPSTYIFIPAIPLLGLDHDIDGIGIPSGTQPFHISGVTKNITATFSQGTRADLLDNLYNNKPTVVSVAWNTSDPTDIGHALTVIGYDPNKGEFKFIDPGGGDEITEKEFLDRYKVTFDQAWLNQPNFATPSGSMVTLELSKPLPGIFPGKRDMETR